jgi:hypothetical protein
MIAKMLEHPEIEFTRSFRMLVRISHDILLAGPGWVIMTVGSQLPLLLHPELLQQLVAEGFRSPIFVMFQFIFPIITFLGIVFWYQDVLVRPVRNSRQALTDRLWTIISFPLLPILTLVLVAIPTLQAQTRLLLGTPLQFRVSRKT